VKPSSLIAVLEQALPGYVESEENYYDRANVHGVFAACSDFVRERRLPFKPRKARAGGSIARGGKLCYCYKPGGFMSKVENIEQEVRDLTPSELAAFRRWFLEFDAQVWDRQIEEDIRDGKLDKLAEEALASHRAGKSKEL
jgi:hypothetical protein